MNKIPTRSESLALTLVIFGLNNKEIAEEMKIKEKGVRDFISNGSKKLGYARFKRSLFISDFFLGRVDDDQCQIIFKYFAERRLKQEHEKNAGLPRGVN